VTLFGPGSELLCGVGQSWQNRPYIGVIKEITCRNQKKLFRREIDWVKRCGRLVGSFGKENGQCDAADCMIAITTEEVISACDRLIKQHA
jgi:prenyltransferase beta subunit